MRGLYQASLRMFDAIRQCPRPVIAAVNGPPGATAFPEKRPPVFPEPS